jgi:hypothetical protein
MLLPSGRLERTNNLTIIQRPLRSSDTTNHRGLLRENSNLFQRPYFTCFAHLSQYLSTIVAPSILKSAVLVAAPPHDMQK